MSKKSRWSKKRRELWQEIVRVMHVPMPEHYWPPPRLWLLQIADLPPPKSKPQVLAPYFRYSGDDVFGLQTQKPPPPLAAELSDIGKALRESEGNTLAARAAWDASHD